MSKLSEIRLLLDAKVKEGIPNPPGSFDPRDLQRISNDKYLYRVLEHSSNSVTQAADMLFNTMVWRKLNNVNDINESSVDRSILENGLFFPHGRDIDSCLLFIMRSKIYVKGQTDRQAVKKVFIYWLERLEREESGKKVTLFLDMDGCGLSNMDLEVFMYIIDVLKSYYPSFINYIIVFQMPWVLGAGFKIIKSVLPASAMDRLKTVNKDKLKDWVAPEQALVDWGGKDNYTFKFEPENRQIHQVDKVNYENYSPGEMLCLNPHKVLEFKMRNNEISAQLDIRNMEDSLVAYKIRTTAPEKYIVKNSSGILSPRMSQNIVIILQNGFFNDLVNKDRFLIVSVQVPKANLSYKELTHIWQTNRSAVDEYRMTCVHIGEKTTLKPHNSMVDVIGKLDDNFDVTNQKLRYINIKQIIIMSFMFINIILLCLTYRHLKRPCHISNYSVN
ncbi:unnamed protein product [Leptidea sinapis]|uniref:MSP domain-containing protein n=1 Tax=Leptidea sinapis TaxID=189913 RepID=A0A5E4R6N5_9NEOP|nr:unnamed protein product [Leptidea sinapis]